MRPILETSGGVKFWTGTTTQCVMSSWASAEEKSKPSATGSWPPSTVRLALCAARRAQAIVGRAAAGARLEVRAGVHVGECEARGDDLAGIAVHVGSRVCDLAGPAEVLVTSTVRDLVAGSGLEFSDRGQHTLKGVPGTWTVLAVQP
jgi:class 3 adenylate cyclase